MLYVVMVSPPFLVYIFFFSFLPSFFCSALCVHIYYSHVTDLMFLSVCVCVYACFISYFWLPYYRFHILAISSVTGSGIHISKTDEESALNRVLQKTAK